MGESSMELENSKDLERKPITFRMAEDDEEIEGETTTEKLVGNSTLDDFVVLGRYTFILCVMCEAMILLQLGNMIYMIYGGAEPTIVSCGSYRFDESLDTKERCSILNQLHSNSSAAGEMECKPEFSAQFKSVNLEWGYYCARNKLVKQSISIQMVGVIIGSAVFGQLSDRYGRKPTLIVALFCCLITMMINGLSTNLFMFTLTRFIINIFNGGCIAIQLVFTVENLPKKDRFWITNLIPWSPNMALFAFVAYMADGWRTLIHTSIVLSLPGVALLFYCSESPRFLIEHQKLDEARAVIKRIWRIDGRKLDEKRLDEMLQAEADAAAQKSKTKKRYSFWHLFYTVEMARYTIAIAFSTLTASLITYSLLFNMEKLSGSMYLNGVYMGMFRYVLNLVSALADVRFKWLGRKLIHAFSEVYIAFGFILYIAIYLLGLHHEYRTVMAIIILTILSQTTLVYTTNGILSSELFPTGVRNTSFSFGQILSRVGVVFAPQIFFLSDVWTPLPYVVILVCTLIDLFSFHFNIKETKGQSMVDRMPAKTDSWLHQRRSAAAKRRTTIGAEELLPVADVEGNPVILP
ncbi:MFS domain-containing protein [Aphelenchoides besseyi]|nr:MFS domain-containing protein [Aphelenchoides besseyi]